MPTTEPPEALSSLVQRVDAAFRNSAADRRRLHDSEWRAGDDTPSVLGEVEVRADAVRGIVLTRLAVGRHETTKLIDIVTSSCFAGSPLLSSWLADESVRFPAFASYLRALEDLRAATLADLQAELGRRAT